ncbi:PREDICTED: uncharacterized protein LOC107191802 [Dufourea novaeangliae]|uniref:uncharacterized protein LOC107191802 n=1 Tax=Dufourea novaeangliae TaxID=178035 RepID=UPI00076700BC|nr:PREDICTED: uncharacterized protein LOC107191802 [Dufourea novaeangliae]XP_015436404.1 PREDICTED: uncharacterized protein LOC107191802 [Dufourea novaeangliae]
MKSLSICLAVAVTVVLMAVQDAECKKMTIEEAKKSIKNLRKVCAKKTDAPKELLDGQHKGEFPKDERLMCYMRCILTTTKAMKNDEIQYEFFAKNSRLLMVDEVAPRVDHTIEVCRPLVTATEGCEVAWQFGKCIFDTDPELYLAP